MCKKEVVIDGKRTRFDAMSALPYPMAISAYGKRYTYIGKSNDFYIDGVKGSRTEYIFFIKRNGENV